VEPQSFEADKVKFEGPVWPAPLLEELSLEGHLRVNAIGCWRKNPSEDFLGRFRHGKIFVPIAQPGALVVMALLEPEGPDSIVSWGLINTIWERHEYPERHTAILLAEKELTARPGLATEFVGLRNGNARLTSVLLAAHPELFRRIGWIPVLKVAGITVTTSR
jgi:hypothetical protein